MERWRKNLRKAPEGVWLHLRNAQGQVSTGAVNGSEFYVPDVGKDFFPIKEYREVCVDGRTIPVY
jgi:hypothetical protein